MQDGVVGVAVPRLLVDQVEDDQVGAGDRLAGLRVDQGRVEEHPALEEGLGVNDGHGGRSAVGCIGQGELHEVAAEHPRAVVAPPRSTAVSVTWSPRTSQRRSVRSRPRPDRVPGSGVRPISTPPTLGLLCSRRKSRAFAALKEAGPTNLGRAIRSGLIFPSTPAPRRPAVHSLSFWVSNAGSLGLAVEPWAAAILASTASRSWPRGVARSMPGCEANVDA